jgi:hypothetical protein
MEITSDAYLLDPRYMYFSLCLDAQASALTRFPWRIHALVDLQSSLEPESRASFRASRDGETGCDQRCSRSLETQQRTSPSRPIARVNPLSRRGLIGEQQRLAKLGFQIDFAASWLAQKWRS